MTITQALEKVRDNWDTLKKSSLGSEYGGTPTEEAVWMVESDRKDPGDYGIDEENIGMLKDGTLIWAYASGCSCWDGDYTHEHIKDIKTFKFEHPGLTEKWKELIIEFAEKMDADATPVSVREDRYSFE